jgi:hypothetical protein
MTRPGTTAAAVAVSIWLATLAIGAPPSAGQRNDDGAAGAPTELQEEYPLHEARACCDDRPAPSFAVVERPSPGPGDGANTSSWAMWALFALIAVLALALVFRLIAPIARAISSTVTAGHEDPTIDEPVYLPRPWRPRRTVRPVVIGLARPLFRYSSDQHAYVLRLIGERHGPALEPMRREWQPRPRHVVAPVVIQLARPLFRYSGERHAYVLRLIGERHGPVLKSRSQAPSSDTQARL